MSLDLISVEILYRYISCRDTDYNAFLPFMPRHDPWTDYWSPISVYISYPSKAPFSLNIELARKHVQSLSWGRSMVDIALPLDMGTVK